MSDETTKVLGKIDRASFGMGGYQESMIGLCLSFKMDGGGVSDFKGAWSQSIEVDEHTKWTEADRAEQYADAVRLLDDTLRKAKRRSAGGLVGTPVELTLNGEGFAGSTLKSWRVLEEVL